MRHLVDLALDCSQLEGDAFSLFELLMNRVVYYFEDSCSSKLSRPSASVETDEGSRLFQILGCHSQMLKGMFSSCVFGFNQCDLPNRVLAVSHS